MDKCRNDACSNKQTGFMDMRGLCPTCFGIAMGLFATNLSSWDALEGLGKILPVKPGPDVVVSQDDKDRRAWLLDNVPVKEN